MIILEWIRDWLWYVCRFFVWIITARDCKHCKHSGQLLWYDGVVCILDAKENEKCLKDFRRPCFKRDKEARG